MDTKATSSARSAVSRATSPNSPQRAAGYVRVSTDEQVAEGLSLDSQSSRIQAYANSQGWELVEIYRDEGHSGKTTNRPQLSRMISAIENGEIDTVLVHRVDRLTRRQKHLWTLLEDVFEPNGVGFKSVIEPFDTTTAQGKAFLGMLAVFAQLERDTISERTTDTLRHKKRVGEWSGRVPFGFRIGANGCLEKDPDQQKLIARVKRLHGREKSYQEIAEKIGISAATAYRIVTDTSRNRRYTRTIRGIPVS